MKKIEELATLMIDEMESFNKSIQALEKSTQKLSELNYEIKNTSVDVDFSNHERMLGKFYKSLTQTNSMNLNELRKIQQNINTLVMVPKRFITALISLSLLLFTSLFFSFYQYNQREEIHQKAFKEGRINLENHMLTFFEDYPKIEKVYRNWAKNNN